MSAISKEGYEQIKVIKNALDSMYDKLNQTEREILYRPLKRFLDSPLKEKHIRRVARQTVQLISKDYQ